MSRPAQGLAVLCSLVLGTVVVWAAPMVVGQGRASLLGIPTVTNTTTCTNAYHIDADCDGYGVGGNGLIGPDADDNDPRVNTTASVMNTYGSITSFLATVKGYRPNHIWYLDGARGSNSNCAGDDPSRPCQTFAYVRGKIAGCDAILIRGGVYDEANSYNFPSVNGSPGCPTIVMAYPGESVTLTHSTSGQNGMYLNSNFATIDGFTITTATPGKGMGIDVTKSSLANGVTIRNMEISRFYTDIWGCAESQNWLIESNVLHNGEAEHNLYLCQNNSSSGPRVGDVIRKNVMYSAARNNIHYNTHQCIGCVIDRNILWSANQDPGGGSASIAIQSGWTNGFITNNVLFNSSAFGILLNDYRDGQAGIGVPHDISRNTIANNTVLFTARDLTGNNNAAGCLAAIAIINGSGVESVDLGHNAYTNNIVVQGAPGTPNCGAAVAYKQQNAHDINWWTTDTWTNNIIFTPTGGAPLAIAPAGVTISGGRVDWAGFGSSVAVFANNSQANPMLQHWDQAEFASPLLFNLRLQAGSPAIGAGSRSAAALVDVLGRTRKDPPTIGAYEFP